MWRMPGIEPAIAELYKLPASQDKES